MYLAPERTVSGAPAPEPWRVTVTWRIVPDRTATPSQASATPVTTPVAGGTVVVTGREVAGGRVDEVVVFGGGTVELVHAARARAMTTRTKARNLTVLMFSRSWVGTCSRTVAYP